MSFLQHQNFFSVFTFQFVGFIHYLLVPGAKSICYKRWAATYTISFHVVQVYNNIDYIRNVIKKEIVMQLIILFINSLTTRFVPKIPHQFSLSFHLDSNCLQDTSVVTTRLYCYYSGHVSICRRLYG